MPKCHNCGQETARTEDWACQWCGYPLFSRSYERIPKTYQQLKKEGQFKRKPEPEAVPEPEPKPAPEPVPVPAPEPQPEPEAMELTAEELLSAYAIDGVAADAKFASKILRVTGVVGMIDVKNMLDTHHIRLTGADGSLLQSLRCVFDKKHAAALNQLTIGQTATVQGKYDGSIIDISMRDCVLTQ